MNKTKLDTFLEYLWGTVFMVCVGGMWSIIYIHAKGW